MNWRFWRRPKPQPQDDTPIRLTIPADMSDDDARLMAAYRALETGRLVLAQREETEDTDA